MPSRATKSSAEHAAILDAIKKRDADLAEELAHEHIMNTIKNISEHGL
jgi:DNA-binding GntR family transcriptional regulator